MLKNRLQSIVKYVDQSDRIVDIGCDHAYLDIELIQKGKCQSTIASDISEGALQSAKKNIKKYGLEAKISCILSDGLDKINPSSYDTIVISGMGASTILGILENPAMYPNAHKIIVQSNNDHPMLRQNMQSKGFYLKDEDIVEEHQKFYITMLWLRGAKKLSKKEIAYGLVPEKNSAYVEKEIQRRLKIIKEMPKKRIFKRAKLLIDAKSFQRYAKQKRQADL